MIMVATVLSIISAIVVGVNVRDGNYGMAAFVFSNNLFIVLCMIAGKL